MSGANDNIEITNDLPVEDLIGNLSEDAKNRLSELTLETIRGRRQGRDLDLHDAQELIKQALLITGYTFGAMAILSSIQGWVALAGIGFILNSTIGVVNKYKGRVKTRLQLEILEKWLALERFDLIVENLGKTREIPTDKVTFFKTMRCRKSVLFTLLSFMLALAVGGYFGINKLAVAGKLASISSVISG
ncbi:MAG: hypothetical protein ACI9TY_000434 [Alphaproteobacteria bacterium]|jgi:hypothetical protein